MPVFRLCLNIGAALRRTEIGCAWGAEPPETCGGMVCSSPGVVENVGSLSRAIGFRDVGGEESSKLCISK